jgi:hypothetical protein
VSTTVEALVEIPGGWHVKDVGNGMCIDVMRMAYNYRVVLSSEEHSFVEAGFCYFGHGVDDNGLPRTMHLAYMRAVAAAVAWDGDEAPEGYDKQAL